MESKTANFIKYGNEAVEIIKREKTVGYDYCYS